MAFVFEANAVKNWSKRVVDQLNEGPTSVKGCSMKFNEQMEKLVQPNVWTGAAASQNFQNFMETHNSLIQFTNNFGASFSEAMTGVAKSVENLEVANLGADSTVLQNFGTLTYTQLTEMSQAIINKEIITYDYGVIASIGATLGSIKTYLETVKDTLNSELNQINNGSQIWEGVSAENAKTTLVNILNTNMSKILENINICISNINKAAEAAQIADSAS